MERAINYNTILSELGISLSIKDIINLKASLRKLKTDYSKKEFTSHNSSVVDCCDYIIETLEGEHG
jgi:hypothetical protein